MNYYDGPVPCFQFHSLSSSALFCAPGAKLQIASPWPPCQLALGRVCWEALAGNCEAGGERVGHVSLCSFSAPAWVSGRSCVSHDYTLTRQPLSPQLRLTLASRKAVSFPCSLVLGWWWLPACQRLGPSSPFFISSALSPLSPLRSSLRSLLCLHITYECLNDSASVWLFL